MMVLFRFAYNPSVIWGTTGKNPVSSTRLASRSFCIGSMRETGSRPNKHDSIELASLMVKLVQLGFHEVDNKISWSHLMQLGLLHIDRNERQLGTET